jgi:hypothetical protein
MVAPVIDKINVASPTGREPEHDPPIRPHGDGPKAFPIALERMKPQASGGSVHALRCIESGISRIRATMPAGSN